MLLAYTQGSAYAEFAESFKGKLIPGYVADFVVLDRDLTKVPAQEILKTQVLRTVVDGRTVYERPPPRARQPSQPLANPHGRAPPPCHPANSGFLPRRSQKRPRMRFL